MPKLIDTCAHDLMDLTPRIIQAIRAEMRQGRTAAISIPQFRTLAFIQRNPDSSLSNLAEHLGLTLPSASKLVDGLVKQKLVARQDSSTDRRRLTLVLTKAGATIIVSARVTAQAHLAKRLKGLSDAELATVHEAMQLLHPIFVEQARSIK